MEGPVLVATRDRARLLWPDCVKGLCIILVVYGHALGATVNDVPIDPTLKSWLYDPLAQFRMPTFFLVAGMWAAKSVQRDARTYLNRTILHLAWIFLVWNMIEASARLFADGLTNATYPMWRLLIAPVFPVYFMWFVWALLLYSLILRLTRRLPLVLLVVATAALHASPIPWPDALRRFSANFVFFATGAALAPMLPGLIAGMTGFRVGLLVAAFLGAEAILLTIPSLRAWPVYEVAVSLVGIAAVVSVCGLIAGTAIGRRLAWIGGRSLSIYVCHVYVNGITREGMLRLGISHNVAVIVLTTTALGVALPLIFHHWAPRVGLGWMLRRPGWLSLPARSDAKERDAESSMLSADNPHDYAIRVQVGNCR